MGRKRPILIRRFPGTLRLPVNRRMGEPPPKRFLTESEDADGKGSSPDARDATARVTLTASGSGK